MIVPLAAAAFAAAVDVSQLHAPYARVQLPAAVDPTPRGDYADLRVRDDRGREIPYALDPDARVAPLVVAGNGGGDEPGSVQDGIQRAVVDLGNADTAVERVRVDARTAAFARDVRVECSDDGESWRAVVSGGIARFGSGTDVLALDAGGERGRFWRVTVDNRDDVPLAGFRVTLLARAHEIVFPAERRRRYVLTFGDPALEAPRYDLATVLRNQPHREGVVPAGPVVALRHRAAPRRLRLPVAERDATRRPRRLVTVAFGIAVAVLGCFALALVVRGGPVPRGAG